MSTVDLNINLIHSTLSHTILCGKVEVSQSLPNSITCPPQCDYYDNHITLDKTVDNTFKEYFGRAPVHPRQFTTYDQSGFQISKYSENRENNMPGTVENVIEPKILLSDIILPQVTEGQQFLILSSYNGLTSQNLDENKKFLVTHDMKIFKSKYDLSQVILFIVDSIEKEISSYCNLTEIFKEVHIKTITKIIPSFVEYIAGSIISGSKPDFQGLLNFGSNVEICTAHFSQDKNYLNATIRRNGRIHITTTSLISSLYFIILLSHSSPNDIKITESTKTNYNIISVPNDIFTLTELQLNIMINGLIFMSELDKFTNNQEFVDYLLSEPLKVVTYLVDSPITKVFNKDFDNIITKYMLQINTQIYSKLINGENRYSLYKGYPSLPPSMKRQVSEY
jgi:hypothetical protein